MKLITFSLSISRLQDINSVNFLFLYKKKKKKLLKCHFVRMTIFYWFYITFIRVAKFPIKFWTVDGWYQNDKFEKYMYQCYYFLKFRY